MAQISPENLRHAMRQWTSGVAVLTSLAEGSQHGMTVNSFTSISLEPPLVCVALAKDARSQKMVEQSGVFGVTILAEDQADISDRFAGRIPEDGDRLFGLELYFLSSGVPLLEDGLVGLDCRVIHSYESQNSVLYVGEVVDIKHTRDGNPLVYHNRIYRRISA
jgi:flavin reductase (DIM6/NTAB) family NADH-FMN oxidoreductase RutF